MANPASAPKGKQSIDELKDALYTRCSLDEGRTDFTTQELLALGIVRDNEILLQCTQRLITERLLKVSKQGDGFVFSVVKREDAAR